MAAVEWCDATGKIWTVCNVSGLTETLKQDIIDNPTKYRKRAMAITGMEFTEDYSIRHPSTPRIQG